MAADANLTLPGSDCRGATAFGAFAFPSAQRACLTSRALRPSPIQAAAVAAFSAAALAIAPAAQAAQEALVLAEVRRADRALPGASRAPPLPCCPALGAL